MFTLLKNIIKYTLYLVLLLIVLITFVPYFFSLKNPPLKSGIKPFENSNYISNGNYFMHYRTFYPTETKYKVLLLHGFSGSTFSFHKNYDSLVQNNCSVVAIDIPPFGYSVKSKDVNYTDTVFANMVLQVLQKADSSTHTIGNWIIAGHSLGVNYVAKLVSRYPDIFSKQIYIDGYYFGDVKSKWTKTVIYPPLLKLADVALEKYFLDEEQFSDMLSSAYQRKANLDEVQAYMQPFAYENSASAIFKLASAENFIEINQKVIFSKPTLVIWGKEDTWVPFKDEDFNIKAFSDITFKMIDSAGHIPMETHAEIVNKYLVTFIKN